MTKKEQMKYNLDKFLDEFDEEKDSVFLYTKHQDTHGFLIYSLTMTDIGFLQTKLNVIAPKIMDGNISCGDDQAH